MRRMPAAPRGSKPCAGCRQPAHAFLPARFHTCLSAHRFCPHFSACTLLSVLSYLYFYNYIFLFVFSYLRFSACTFPLALYARSFPLVLFRPRFPVCTFLIALFCLAFSFPLFPSRSFPPALSCLLFPACASLSIPSHSVIVPSSLFQPFQSFIRAGTLGWCQEARGKPSSCRPHKRHSRPRSSASGSPRGDTHAARARFRGESGRPAGRRRGRTRP